MNKDILDKGVDKQLTIRLINHKGKTLLSDSVISILKDIKRNSKEGQININYKYISKEDIIVLKLLGLFVSYDLECEDYSIIWHNTGYYSYSIDNIDKII